MKEKTKEKLREEIEWHKEHWDVTLGVIFGIIFLFITALFIISFFVPLGSGSYQPSGFDEPDWVRYQDFWDEPY